MMTFPGRRDARWNNPSWRTRTLQELVATNVVTVPEIADLLHRTVGMAYHWHSGNKLIARNTMRLLILEIQERDRREA